MKNSLSAKVSAVVFFLLLSLFLSANANADTTRVYDNAKCFSAEEITALEEKIHEFRLRTKTDFCILITDDFLGNDPLAIAGIFYDSMGLGIGPNQGGIVLYIDLYNRIPAISTCGEMVLILSGDKLDSVFDSMYTFLADGEYSVAMIAAIEQVDSILADYWARWLGGGTVTE